MTLQYRQIRAAPVHKNLQARQPQPMQIRPQNLDGKEHTTYNNDGSSTSYQGTTGTTSTKDANGNVVSSTTTTTVTSQTLNAHGDVVQTTTTTNSTTVDAKGNVTSRSTSVEGVAVNSELAQSMRDGARHWYQTTLPDWLPVKQEAAKTILKRLDITPQDVQHGFRDGMHCTASDVISCPD